MINLQEPYICGKELGFIKQAIQQQHLSGAGYFTGQCERWLEAFTTCPRVLLTTSCTHALEIAAILMNIQPGDEIIMPSFTFVSSANAFVLRGAKVVFVDVHPDTMNINEALIEAAITKKTRGILVMHYAGVACEMDEIMAVAASHGLMVIEDAAQGMDAWYKGRHLGTIGHFGTLSFHATKNIQCGEGGALLINDNRFAERAEIIREKGTNRKAFFSGKVDKYSWVDIGSSYLLNEMTAAFLYAQFKDVKKVSKRRRMLWDYYYKLLVDKQAPHSYQLSEIPQVDRAHNGHLFFMFVQAKDRSDLIQFLKEEEIKAAFHYVPLHLSKYGKKVGQFIGEDHYTSSKSSALIRLPLYYNLKKTEIKKVVTAINKFYQTF